MSRRLAVRVAATLTLLLATGAGLLGPLGPAQGYVQGEQIAGNLYAPTADALFLRECPVGSTPRGIRVVSVRGFSNDVRMLCEKGGVLQSSPAGAFEVPDGVSEDLLCPTGRRVAGLTARTGSIVDSIGVRCADAEDVRSDGPISLGQGGFPDGPVDCPPLSVLRGIAGATSSLYSGAEAQVSMVQRICSQLTVLTKLTRGPLQLQPRARLVVAATGEPLSGRRISFGVCSARTNAQGIATCPIALGIGPVTATYGGDQRTEPSSARS